MFSIHKEINSCRYEVDGSYVHYPARQIFKSKNMIATRLTIIG